MTGMGAGFGRASIPLTLPSWPSGLYCQWAVQDSVNAVGVVTSDGRHLVIR